MLYRVEISFCGYIGATREYEVEADSLDEAKEMAMEAAIDDLEVDNAEELENEED